MNGVQSGLVTNDAQSGLAVIFVFPILVTAAGALIGIWFWAGSKVQARKIWALPFHYSGDSRLGNLVCALVQFLIVLLVVGFIGFLMNFWLVTPDGISIL